MKTHHGEIVSVSILSEPLTLMTASRYQNSHQGETISVWILSEKFNQSGNLKIYIRIHTMEKPNHAVWILS